MRAHSFIDEPQRELLWATIQYRDELVLCMTALEWLNEEARRGTKA